MISINHFKFNYSFKQWYDVPNKFKNTKLQSWFFNLIYKKVKNKTLQEN